MIANEFGEAANQPLHSSALFAAGFVLFVLTLIVNIIARWFVVRGTRGMRPPQRSDDDGEAMFDATRAATQGQAVSSGL